MATTGSRPNPGELRVTSSAEAVAQAAAELFVQLCDQSIGARGRFRVALSGGSTPKRTYQLLADNALAGRVDWSRVDLFWGDERYVPHDDPNSNYRMTSEALLRHISIPETNVHGVPTDVSPPEAAASAYESEIRNTFGNPTSIPAFDLVYLGLGTNGHTASLFPHSATLLENSRLVVADFVNEVNNWRISMTAPLLNRGRTVAFLVSGREKADVLRQVMLGPREPDRLPAQLIVPEGKLLWLTDEAAASLLPHQQHNTPQERAS
jgi:6-phosphogluconolactonase